MALEYKKLNDKLENTPLTLEELKMVDKVEGYIDKQITKHFKGYEVKIELVIVDFKYDIDIEKISNLPDARKYSMRKEIDKRYKEAGWKVSVEIDDGLDGPNMSGPDYWVISGK